MAHASSNANGKAKIAITAAETKQIVLKDIGARWDKFSDHDLSALQNVDDLVAKVMDRYGIDLKQARSEVATLLDGRQL